MSELRINVLLPAGRYLFGGWDPLVAALGGVSPLDILSSLLGGRTPFNRQDPDGAVEVYELGIPDGEGANLSFPIGDLGFFNRKGILELTVPVLLSRQVPGHFHGMVKRGPAATRNAAGITSHQYDLALRPGATAAFTFGTLKLGVEVPAR